MAKAKGFSVSTVERIYELTFYQKGGYSKDSPIDDMSMAVSAPVIH